MASRFWVGGTGTWDSSDTTHWAATSGGAGGQSVPGSADTVTFDANSGGGTVTLNFGGTITIQSMTTGAFAGTWDNSVNNNNITFTAVSGWDNANVGVRTMKLGTATYTLTSTSAQWNWGTTVNLTNTGNTGAFIVFSGPEAGTTCQFIGDGLSYGNLSLGAASGNGFYNVAGSNTFASVSIAAPNCVRFIGTTTTITTAFTWTGTSTSQIFVASSSIGSNANIAAAASSGGQWCGLRDITCTGSPVFTNSFNLGGTSGSTITAPSTGISARTIVAGRGSPY
jgi:hypothetical protein